MRRAKIVCTLGPATNSLEQIRALVAAGMDVARLNLSHGDHSEHEQRYAAVRKASEEAGRGVAILVDLQGPKIRVGTFPGGPIELERGATFTLTTEDVPGDRTRVSTTYAGLPGDVRQGDPILLDDGRLQLRAISIEEHAVVTRVEEGGMLSNHKGINLPGVAVSVPAMSTKDVDDLRWGLRMGADLIALSFVRSGKDIEDVRRIMVEEGVTVPVIAKIEKPQAVDCLEEIVDAFDAIMVARGDLGVEMPLEQVPLVQKRAVTLARRYAKPVIVATQMLESMIDAPRPTRAEASDVANAVLDGADAVMLSGETSVGRYAIQTVRTMARIVEQVEDNALEMIPPLGSLPHTTGGAITRAAAEIGDLLGAKYLVTFTISGDSARRMSRLRGAIPLLAFTPVPETRKQLALSWGVETFLAPAVDHTDGMVEQVDQALLDLGRCRDGDIVVVVNGSPPGVTGGTNAIRVHRMGTSATARPNPRS